MQKEFFNQEAVENFDSPDNLSGCIKMTTRIRSFGRCDNRYSRRLL